MIASSSAALPLSQHTSSSTQILISPTHSTITSSYSSRSTSPASSTRTSISDTDLLSTNYNKKGHDTIDEGQEIKQDKNPYKALISQCSTPLEMIQAYETHRRTRNKLKFNELSTTKRVSPDYILAGLVLDHQPPEFDPRNCVTVWGRPTTPVMDLIGTIQLRLIKALAPFTSSSSSSLQKQLIDHVPETFDDTENTGPLWLMPRTCLHLSALEITHSVPVEVVEQQLVKLRPFLDRLLNSNMEGNTTTLTRPLLCFDAAALALTFVPVENSEWTYTHYRSRLYEFVQNFANVTVDSRYQVPSAHVTIARFIEDVSERAVDALLEEILKINEWLEQEWKSLEWTIGDERATECRCGRIWYGGGWSEGQGVVLDKQKMLDL